MRHSFYDFVVPKGNEDDFCKMANKLGYQGIFFSYTLGDFLAIKGKLDEMKKKLSSDYKLDIYFSIICDNEKDIEKAKKLTKSVVLISNKESDIRNIVQKFRPSIITNTEFQTHDFMHHRAGINQVIAIAMKDNNVSYGISLKLLFSSKYKAEIIGRMKQNVMLVKKYSVPIKIFSLAKDPYEMKGFLDIVSFAVFLGMNPGQAKRSLNK